MNCPICREPMPAGGCGKVECLPPVGDDPVRIRIESIESAHRRAIREDADPTVRAMHHKGAPPEPMPDAPPRPGSEADEERAVRHADEDEYLRRWQSEEEPTGEAPAMPQSAASHRTGGKSSPVGSESVPEPTPNQWLAAKNLFREFVAAFAPVALRRWGLMDDDAKPIAADVFSGPADEVAAECEQRLAEVLAVREMHAANTGEIRGRAMMRVPREPHGGERE